MTHRIHSSVPPAAPGASHAPRRTLRACAMAREAAAEAAPRCALDRAWSMGYMAVCVTAIAAACAVANGETASAELRFATVAAGSGSARPSILEGAKIHALEPVALESLRTTCAFF